MGAPAMHEHTMQRTRGLTPALTQQHSHRSESPHPPRARAQTRLAPHRCLRASPISTWAASQPSLPSPACPAYLGSTRCGAESNRRSRSHSNSRSRSMMPSYPSRAPSPMSIGPSRPTHPRACGRPPPLSPRACRAAARVLRLRSAHRLAYSHRVGYRLAAPRRGLNYPSRRGLNYPSRSSPQLLCRLLSRPRSPPPRPPPCPPPRPPCRAWRAART